MGTEKSDYHGWDEPTFPVNAVGDLKNFFDQIDDGAILTGTLANRPAASTAGRLYLAYDEPAFFRDDGSSWDDVSPGGGVSVSDSGTTVQSESGDVNFANALSASSDGDGTASVVVDESAISHDNIAGVSSADHHARYTDSEAQDAVGAIVANALVYDSAAASIAVDESAISHDNIAGVSSADHHAKYTDEESQDAIGTILSGQFTYDDATPTISLDQGDGSGLNADSVDGLDAGDLGVSKQFARLTSTNTGHDLNQGSFTAVPWDVAKEVDSSFTRPSNTQLTVGQAGKYRIETTIAHNSDGNSRQNPKVRIRKNGSTLLDGAAKSGYMRDREGHSQSSSTLSIVEQLAAGDTLEVVTKRDADSGTVTMNSRESVWNVESIERLVKTKQATPHVGSFQITGTGDIGVTGVGFTPSSIEFSGEAVGGQNVNRAGGGGSSVSNYAGTFSGTARSDGHRQVIHSGASGDSINETSHFSSDSLCIAIRYAGKNGSSLGTLKADVKSFDSDGFTVNVSSYQQNEIVNFTAYP